MKRAKEGRHLSAAIRETARVSAFRVYRRCLAMLYPVLTVLLLLASSGCATMANRSLAETINHAILNQDDPATVKTGAPAYLLLIDGFIQRSPGDGTMLIAGSKLYAAYAAVFVEDEQRARRMAGKAYDYASRALCQRESGLCAANRIPYDAFVARLPSLGDDDLPALFASATAWALLIQTRSDDWNALANLPKVEAMLERVLALEEEYEQGQAHLYLGVLRSLRPPSAGGRPEVGRSHFEKAIAMSEGRNLMAKVELARRYARLVFERALHDRLLREVLEADPYAPDLTLSNILAQQEAQRLLDTSAAYFGE